jgi:hypothetical protein
VRRRHLRLRDRIRLRNTQRVLDGHPLVPAAVRRRRQHRLQRRMLFESFDRRSVRTGKRRHPVRRDRRAVRELPDGLRSGAPLPRKRLRVQQQPRLPCVQLLRVSHHLQRKQRLSVRGLLADEEAVRSQPTDRRTAPWTSRSRGTPRPSRHPRP